MRTTDESYCNSSSDSSPTFSVVVRRKSQSTTHSGRLTSYPSSPPNKLQSLREVQSEDADYSPAGVNMWRRSRLFCVPRVSQPALPQNYSSRSGERRSVSTSKRFSNAIASTMRLMDADLRRSLYSRCSPGAKSGKSLCSYNKACCAILTNTPSLCEFCCLAKLKSASFCARPGPSPPRCPLIWRHESPGRRLRLRQVDQGPKRALATRLSQALQNGPRSPARSSGTRSSVIVRSCKEASTPTRRNLRKLSPERRTALPERIKVNIF